MMGHGPTGGAAMPAYIMVDLKLDDRSWLEGYVPPVQELIKKHGGRYIVRAFEYEQLEGERRPEILVVLEFPSMDAARAFYNDPEYQPPLEIAPGRLQERDL